MKILTRPNDGGAQRVKYSLKERENDMNDFLKNLNLLSTTEMGVKRIKRNLGIDTDEVVAWCKAAILKAEKSLKVVATRNGKNWYVYTSDIAVTVNAGSFTIITAHKLKTAYF